MAYLTKPPYSKPIPAGGTIFTRNGQRFARWTTKKGKTATAPLTEDGQRVRLYSRCWYVVYRDADGIIRKVKGYPREPLVVADLTLDPNTREVYRSGTRIALSKKETFLLEYLMKNSGRVVTRSMIAQAVWDTDTSQYTNVIDVFINHLRKKIDNVEPRLLHTVRGKGFRLTDSPEDFEGDA